MLPPLPFVAEPEDEVELTVVDLGVARAFWEGVPTGRLLARARLHRDERDLVDIAGRATGAEFADASWDTILARLLASSPPSLDRVKRAVARHARAASDEGPLAASDNAIAALVHAHLASADVDASPAEGAADALPVDEVVADACRRYDERLERARGDARPAAFEACLELARRISTPPWPLFALRDTLDALAEANATVDTDVLLASPLPLYPWSDDGAVAIADRRACLLDRAALERVVLQPERERAVALARAVVRHPELAIATIAGEMTVALSKHGALLLVVTRAPRSIHAPPPLPPASWQPVDPETVQSAATLAAAIERGSITGPRARTLLLHGGDAALDAIGKEMLDVTAHPFASSVFAELLAPRARERDVVRLVTYFAIAPDPSIAARALDFCAACDVVCTVLRSWLETMLPTDGAPAEPGSDPGSRVASCIAALRPYPALYQAVRPLLSRISEPPKV